MKAAVEVMQTMADQAGVTLCITTLSQTLPQLWADSDRLLQLLTNLLSNAVKFSHPSSTVWLTAEIQELSCQRSIGSTGVSLVSSQKKPGLLTKDRDTNAAQRSLG